MRVGETSKRETLNREDLGKNWQKLLYQRQTNSKRFLKI